MSKAAQMICELAREITDSGFAANDLRTWLPSYSFRRESSPGIPAIMREASAVLAVFASGKLHWREVDDILLPTEEDEATGVDTRPELLSKWFESRGRPNVWSK